MGAGGRRFESGHPDLVRTLLVSAAAVCAARSWRRPRSRGSPAAPPFRGSVTPLPASLRATMTGALVAPRLPGRPRRAPPRARPPLGLRRATCTPVASSSTATSRGAVLDVLRRLYAARFPIRRMVPVDAYGASDFRSIEADNTSAFNCRYVDGTTRWSEHAYGRAIDLNPIENPYVTAAGTTSHRREPPLSPTRAVPAGNGGRGRRRRARVRGGRLGLGRPLVGRPRLPALLGERAVTGALALLAGAALLAFGSLRVACLLSPRSTASFLLAAYVVGWVQLVLVLWALSAFDWVSRGGCSAALAVVCAALAIDTRGRSDVGVQAAAKPRRRCGGVAGARRGRARARGARRVRVCGRARARHAAERLRHARRPPLARGAVAPERGRRLPGLRLRPVHQRVPAARGARRARDDGARRDRPLRRARPGRGLRRARARRDRGRPCASARPL